MSDGLYAQAAAEGVYQPWKEPPDAGCVMDLHGFSAAEACAAVRRGLWRDLLPLHLRRRDAAAVDDWWIITGTGHSRNQEAVLRPRLQRLLRDEFRPALDAVVLRHNPGCLLVGREDVLRWLEAQRRGADARPGAAAAAAADAAR